MGDDPLALDTRRRLYDAVRQTPGISAREIQRAAGTAWGETAYHLERLAQGGLVHRERGGHQDYYFCTDLPLGDRTLLRMARSPAIRRLLVVLLETPDVSLAELSERAELSLSRSSIHLRRLLETGMVGSDRRGALRTFAIVDRDRIARALVAYRESFSDAWIERLVDTFGEMFPP
ncbi:MAG TPA: winged helix-turn-helix transcriptional regulator [Thermoplasmata archaeon]|nr:winged helix-turn-helix transcriptional regulator [Thermoplasmata archaeon]